MWKQLRLENPAINSFRVLAVDKRSFFIDQAGVVDQVSADRAIYVPLPVEPVRREIDDLIMTEVQLQKQRRDGSENVVE